MVIICPHLSVAQGRVDEHKFYDCGLQPIFLNKHYNCNPWLTPLFHKNRWSFFLEQKVARVNFTVEYTRATFVL